MRTYTIHPPVREDSQIAIVAGTESLELKNDQGRVIALLMPGAVVHLSVCECYVCGRTTDAPVMIWRVCK